MAAISTFYGIIVYLYVIDIQKHHRPHVHVKYNEFWVEIALDAGEVLEGDIPNNKMKLVQAWIEIHHQELMADWQLAANGRTPYKIEPLK